MKSKIIKSNQVGCETPSISCSCGGGCFGCDTVSTYDYSESKYYCELCGRTTKEETELDDKLNKYLCEGCRKEYERKK